MISSKTENIFCEVFSLLSSNPGIKEDNKPGRHRLNSFWFNFKKQEVTIFSRNISLLEIDAYEKNGNKPLEYIPKLSANLLLFFERIF